eukprot:6575427-Alexandrium_andersonii.AAC.1
MHSGAELLREPEGLVVRGSPHKSQDHLFRSFSHESQAYVAPSHNYEPWDLRDTRPFLGL